MRCIKNFGLICLVLIFILSIETVLAYVTTTEVDGSKIYFGSVQKIYEISPSTLEIGYAADLHEKEAFKLFVSGKKYYIVLWNVSKDYISIIVPGRGNGTIRVGETRIVDLFETEGYKDSIILTLNSIKEKTANILIKKYHPELPSSVAYKELFDIEVGLAKTKIYDTNELTANIKFLNFGEGPSHINIEYAIVNENNTEFYRVADDKVVYTEDSIVKTFDSLTLNPGKYKLAARITYGKNQTAASEKGFEILEKPFYLKYNVWPLAVLLLVVVAFYIITKTYSYKNQSYR